MTVTSKFWGTPWLQHTLHSICDNSELPWWFNCTYRHLYPQGTVKVCLHLLLSLWRTCPTASTPYGSLHSVIQQTNSELGLPLQRKQAPQCLIRTMITHKVVFAPCPQGKEKVHTQQHAEKMITKQRHQQAREQINPWYHNTWAYLENLTLCSWRSSAD